MSKQTAVDWLIDMLDIDYNDSITKEVIKQAKAMEKEQITKTARQCHFEGVRQSAKTSEEYIAYGEQYYNQTYGGTND
jgi:hypothetical protein